MRRSGCRDLNPGNLLTPSQARYQAAPHPELCVLSESVSARGVLELTGRDPLGSSTPPVSDPLALVADPAQAATLHGDARIDMATHAPCGVSLQTRLRPEPRQRLFRLEALCLSQPRPDSSLYPLDPLFALDDPLEVVWFAVTFDASHSVQRRSESHEHRRR